MRNMKTSNIIGIVAMAEEVVTAGRSVSISVHVLDISNLLLMSRQDC